MQYFEEKNFFILFFLLSKYPGSWSQSRSGSQSVSGSESKLRPMRIRNTSYIYVPVMVTNRANENHIYYFIWFLPFLRLVWRPHRMRLECPQDWAASKPKKWYFIPTVKLYKYSQSMKHEQQLSITSTDRYGTFFARY